MSEVIEPLMERSEAERITERIRLTVDTTARNLDKLAKLVAEAFERRADLALGYGSWAEYSNAEFGEETRDLAPQFRRQLVGMLSAEGMSTRAIAPAVGVTQKTIVKDTQFIRDEVIPQVSPAEPTPSGSTLATPSGVVIAEQRHVELVDTNTGEIAETAPEPRKVTGLDGKKYAAPKQQPAAQRRTPLTEQFLTQTLRAIKAAEALERLASDDRFPRNKEEIAAINGNDLHLTIDALQRVIDALTK